MKTYKQLFQQAMNEKSKLHDEFMKLRYEHWKLIDNRIGLHDTNLLQYLVEGLEDIRKNGGSYSSVKAVELLFALGKLK